MCPMISIGVWHVESYAVMTYLAVFAGLSYLYLKLVGVEKIDRFQAVLFLIWFFFAQLIGGQIIPFIWRWYRRGHFPQDLLLGGSGRFFHSVLIAAVVFIIVYCKIKNWAVKRFLDYLAPAGVLASAIGRIGCFLTGCCAGKPTNLPWAVQFPNKPDHVHPTQLYHFGFELFVLFPLLLWIDKRKRADGQTFWSFMLIYSFFRFWIEYIRANPIAWLNLTHAQLFSAIAFVVSGIILAKQYNR